MSATETKLTATQKIKFEWTSDSSGDATVTTSNIFDGSVLECVTVPGSAGNQPTDQYDITITDSDSIDVLHGNGANRSNASTEYIVETNLGTVVNSKLTLTVANAGDTKSGVVYLFIRT